MFEIWAEYVASEGEYYLLQTEEEEEMAHAIVVCFIAATGAHAYWEKKCAR